MTHMPVKDREAAEGKVQYPTKKHFKQSKINHNKKRGKQSK